MFEQYPKIRPPLPDRIETIYAEQYRSNREGETLASKAAQTAESWMHRQVARDVLGQPSERRSTLELGSGTLNQLPYEPEVGPYDIVEPFSDLYVDSPAVSRVRDAWSDVSQVPDGARYDRITSVAALEHISNLPEVVARCGLLLSSGGVFRAAIPRSLSNNHAPIGPERTPQGDKQRVVRRIRPGRRLLAAGAGPFRGASGR